MNIHLPFPVPGNRKDRAARWRSKPPAHRPPLTLEALEELTVPSAMPGALAAVSALLPSGPAITAPLAPGGAPAGGALHRPGGIPARVSSSHSLQAPLPAPSKVLSTLASDLRQRTGQLSGITGNPLRGTVQQLANATQVVSRAAGRSLSQPLSLTSSTAPLIEILLSNRARDPGAILSNLSSLAGSATANTAQQLNRIVTIVTGNLNSAASSLQALSSTQSGTTATTTGDATAQLARVMTDVAGSMHTVLSSLNTLVGVLPDLISMAVSHIRQYLHAALLDVTDSLGAISGSLDTIADRLAGVIGSLPSAGPIASAPDDGSASPPNGSSIDGVLTEVSDTLSTIANLLGTLAGSLSSVLASATAAASGPSSSAAGARQVIDTLFGGVA
jgi:hypothetical protein